MKTAAVTGVFAFAIASLGACGQIRSGPPEGASAAPDSGISTTTNNSVSGDQALKLAPAATDFPNASYRAVHAVSKNRVFVVGDESILEWDGKTWTKTTVGGVELNGVWGNETWALAVGSFKNSNRGVAMLRAPNRWVQFATVEHGLRSVWGSGTGDDDRVVVVGNDGATYFGNPTRPMEKGVQQDVPADTPQALTQTLFFPVMAAVGGNSPNHVVVAGPVGTFYKDDGTNWKGEVQKIDPTRTYSAVWGPLGKAFDVVLGANYYGLWYFAGTDTSAETGKPGSMLLMLNEERDDIQRAQQYIYGIWGESTSRFLAVGSSGRVMLFEGKEKPRIMDSPAGGHDLRGISGTGWDDLWVVGDDGIVLHGSLSLD